MTEAIGRLTHPAELVRVQPLTDLVEVASRLPSEASWGFYTTPTEARLLRGPAARWQEIAALRQLQELRVFGPERDVHWLRDRGVELAVVAREPSDPGEQRIGGAGWLQRERRSRLWGEHLLDDRWYEERIPDPLCYEGLAPARFAFLLYREYVRDGAVRYVRYLSVEGGA